MFIPILETYSLDKTCSYRRNKAGYRGSMIRFACCRSSELLFSNSHAQVKYTDRYILVKSSIFVRDESGTYTAIHCREDCTLV